MLSPHFAMQYFVSYLDLQSYLAGEDRAVCFNFRVS